MATPSERIEAGFPAAKARGYQITSPSDPCYNCFAWAVGVADVRWGTDTDDYWPAGLPRHDHIDVAVQVLAGLGFEVCAESNVEPGFEKVALYGLPEEETWMHAARQLPDGQWTSKLGPHEDIMHDTLAVLEGGEYGVVIRLLRRRLT